MDLLLKILLLSPIVAITAADRALNSTISANSAPSPPPQQPPPSMAPFKPSIAVIVAVLTTMFSITFLLLLYAKHCKGGNESSDNSRARVPPSEARKNSGVDRTVIQSLPVFRFGSLRGEKEGLECAVCLNRFEPVEVLRLLPKCKHAFHVECVDTWLDAHSTCPLCRYRVEPEDILLLGNDGRILGQNEAPPQQPPVVESLRRVSGRHSSAGERGTGGGFLQIVLGKPGEDAPETQGGGVRNCPPARRSFDSWSMRKKKSIRKDELLLTAKDRASCDRRRLEHRIIVGDGGAGGGGGIGLEQRWSDVQPSDLLYIRSEMIMSDSRRLSASSSGSRLSIGRHHNPILPMQQSSNNGEQQSGRSVINGRSMSEITGLSRFGKGDHHRRQPQRRSEWWRGQEAGGLLSRWLAWVSPSQSQQTQTQQPVVR